MWKPTRLHAQQISLSMFEILACCTLDITAGMWFPACCFSVPAMIARFV